MAEPTSAALPAAGSEPQNRTSLLLESIALRHQIAVLKRSRTSMYRLERKKLAGALDGWVRWFRTAKRA